jgi:hypothetical protein
MPRPTLASLLEDFRNWNKTQDWMLNKQRDIYGNEDPDTIALNEKLAGIGTADMGMLGSSVGGLAGMIRASHGSPHLFNKFDFSKIGTGAGAQSYGHGGYFAQGFDSPTATGYKVIRESNTPGHLYNVELKWPDVAKETTDPFSEHHLLSWDEKFQQQPENVKDAVIKALHSDAYKTSQAEPIPFNPNAEPSWMADLFTGEKAKFNPSDYYGLHANRTGEQIYNSLVERFGGEKEATALLREYGLPGIRYLDEASKASGKGTSNYVIFDEQIPNIVSRNGVSLTDLLRR